MKKACVVLLLVVAVLALTVTPGDAHWRGGVHIGIGPYWGPYPYYWYPPPYYYVYRPPAVVVEQPPVYVQRQPAPPAEPAPTIRYWYYCASGKGYYPTVPSCAEEWIKVPERPQ
jgi:hypothetical protein